MSEEKYLCYCEECIWETSLPSSKDMAEDSAKMHKLFTGHSETGLSEVPSPDCPECGLRTIVVHHQSEGYTLLSCENSHRYVFDDRTGEVYHNKTDE